MANPEHLAILKQGAEVWNDWRKNNPRLHWGIHSKGADLDHAKLSGKFMRFLSQKPSQCCLERSSEDGYVLDANTGKDSAREILKLEGPRQLADQGGGEKRGIGFAHERIISSLAFHQDWNYGGLCESLHAAFGGPSAVTTYRDSSASHVIVTG